MSITYPIDLLADWPGWATLTLSYGDETSGQAGGQVRVRSVRSPLWTLKAETKRLRPNVFRRWKARLESLENGKKTFLGYDMSACYPIAYPRGSWPTGGAFSGNAVIQSVSSAIAISLSALPAGYTVTEGDFVSISSGGTIHGLHQAMEQVTANGAGVTPAFEVRPPLRQGVAPGNVAALKRPQVVMMLQPGSLSMPASLDGRGTISFDAVQVI